MLVLPCALRARQFGLAEDSVGWMDRLADEWMGVLFLAHLQCGLRVTRAARKVYRPH